MRKNCSSARKKIERKVCKFKAERPRICNVFEIFVPHTIEQFFSHLVRNIMVPYYFFVYSYFFNEKKKIIKNFWVMEIIGNIRKNTINIFKMDLFFPYFLPSDLFFIHFVTASYRDKGDEQD